MDKKLLDTKTERRLARVFYLLRILGLVCLGLGFGKMVGESGLWSLPVLLVGIGALLLIGSMIWMDWRRGVYM